MNKNTIINKVIEAGILNHDLTNLNHIQNEVYESILNGTYTSPSMVINEYIDYANVNAKQMFLYRKILSKRRSYRNIKGGIIINLNPEDIPIPDYCPYLNTKLSYKTDKLNKLSKFSVSIDRIDNSKGYVKGNIMVISRLANTIKNEASIDELKVFSLNIIKRYKPSNS